MSSADSEGRGLEREEPVLDRKLGLAEMLDVPALDEVVRGLAELYRVGIRVLDERGARLVEARGGNGDLCGLVGGCREGRSRCAALMTRVDEGPVSPTPGVWTLSGVSPLGGEPTVVPCFTGLRYLVLPVLWEGDVLGRVVLGPFAPDTLVGPPPSLREVEGVELARAGELLAALGRLSEEQAGRMLAHLAQVVSALLVAGQKSYLVGQLHLEAMMASQRDLEQQNAQLQRLNQRLTEADRLKSSFLGTVSHELRTPLASIIGYSEMLAEGLVGELNPEQLQFARTIVDKGNSLLKLIASILDMSHIESGKVRLAFEWVEVAEMLRGAVTSVTPQAQRKGLELHLEGAEEALPPVTADREKLQQVVVNLLANAVKFTPGGGRVDVRLSGLKFQPELGMAGYRIEVEDTGVGIAEEQRERIFQSFYQVDSGPTRAYGGAGLGLAIVKSYVEGHGGQVGVRSEMGRGSCFTVVLPREPPSSGQGPVYIPPPASEPDRF